MNNKKIYVKNKNGNELRLSSSSIEETTKALRKNELRIIQEGGNTYYDVPAIILGEAVLTGINYPYPELISRRLLTSSAEDWNDIPVVVYHPYDNAKTLEVIEAELIGRVYKPQIIVNEDNYDEPFKLKVMVRLEESLLKKNAKGEKILDKINNGQLIELSTGYYLTDYIEQNGVYNGQPFNGIQLSIIPNHLAILPEDTDLGAYSIEKGAGLGRENELRTNKQGELMKERELLQKHGYSDTALDAMSDAELKLTSDLVANKAKNEKAEDADERFNRFKTEYLESDEFMTLVENKANEIVESEKLKTFRDNAWKELEGKTTLSREDLDAMPNKAVEVLLNALKSVEKPPTDSDAGSGGNEDETPEGVDFENN